MCPLSILTIYHLSRMYPVQPLPLHVEVISRGLARLVTWESHTVTWMCLVSKAADNTFVVADNSEGNNRVTTDYNKDIPTTQPLPKGSLCVKPLSKERFDLRSAGGNLFEESRGFGTNLACWSEVV